MTNAQKAKLRVAIAKDVIASLPLMNIEEGTYLEGRVDESLQAKGSKAVAKALKKNCTVCALGACLLSAVSLGNAYTFKFGDFSTSAYHGDANIEEGFPAIFRRLRRIFSAPQLTLIESAFEKYDMRSGERLSDKQSLALELWINIAKEFGMEEVDDADRLHAIMANIVENKGLFIPMPSLKAIQ